jgi:CheY-like chemotaxis protein/PAS domain-containing protein
MVLFLYDSSKEYFRELISYQYKVALIGFITLVSAFIGAVIGVTNLYLYHFFTESHYLDVFYTWFLGDAISILLFIPLALKLKNEKLTFLDFISALMAFFMVYLFRSEELSGYVYIVFFTLLIPFSIASLNGLYLSSIVIACVLNWFLINHEGPFAFGHYDENLLSMQFFILSISLCALTLEGFKKTKLVKNTVFSLVFFWSIFGVIYYQYQKEIKNKNIIVVDGAKNHFKERMSDKHHRLIDTLYSLEGFIINSKRITNEEWINYISQSHHLRNVESLSGIIVTFYNKDLKMLEYFSGKKRFVEPSVIGIYQVPQIIINHKGEFLIAHTVFKKNQKIANIYSFIEMNLFFKNIISTSPFPLDVDIYDQNKKLIFQNIIDKRMRDNENIIENYTLSGYPFVFNWNETSRYLVNQVSEDTVFILLTILLSASLTAYFLNIKMGKLDADDNLIISSALLEESELKFKMIFEGSNDAKIIFNRHKIIECNQKALEMFNKKLKLELVSMPLDDLFILVPMNAVFNGKLLSDKMLEAQQNPNVAIEFECFCFRNSLPFHAHFRLTCLVSNHMEIFVVKIIDLTQKDNEQQLLTYKAKENVVHKNAKKILLVEDNEVNLIVTTKFLEKWGYQVYHARNGQEAIEHKFLCQVHLILMDLDMPVLNGFEAAAIIDELQLNIPIIALTANISDNSSSDNRISYFKYFVNKPFDPKEFQILIEKLLNS